jgi:hypothetical protein
MRQRSRIGMILLALAGAACESPKRLSPEERAAAAASAGVNQADAREAARRRKWAPPSGPILPVEPGSGLGAIRLGASVATLERLMGKPCEVRTEYLCRYVSHGVDFHLRAGVTESIHVQRAGRSAGTDYKGEPIEFGFFNGAIPPDLRLGMVPSAIQEYLGPPERIEHVPQPNPATLVSRDYYPGIVIEYDRYTNGKIILGGMRIVKAPPGAAVYRYTPPAPREPPSGAAGAAATAAKRRREVVR